MRYPHEVLAIQSAPMKERIMHLVRRHRSGEIDDPVYAALYFLCWQMAMHGRRCAARKYRCDPRPDPFSWWNDMSDMDGEDLRKRLVHYLESYNFLGVSAKVSVALCSWLRKRWSLLVCEYIPHPEAVLGLQIRGTRPVTILCEFPRMCLPVLNKNNAYEFMVHDLEHAYKYFHDVELYHGQKRFFAAVKEVIQQGILDEYRLDPTFSDKLNYLISDMNTHFAHSVQFLRAILIDCLLRRENKPPAGILSGEAIWKIDTIMKTLIALLPLHIESTERGQSFISTPQYLAMRP